MEKYTDYHYHLNKYFVNFKSRKIAKKTNKLLKYSVVVSTGLKDSIFNIELAKEFDNIHPAIGIHPLFEGNLKINKSKNLIQILEKMILENKNDIWGLGEIGLDFRSPNHIIQKFPWYAILPKIYLSRKYKIKSDNQLYYFEEQLKLARKYKLPVSVHVEASSKYAFEILSKYNDVEKYMHNWTYDLDKTKKFAKLSNIKFGFNYSTIQKNKDIGEILKYLDESMTFVETDYPGAKIIEDNYKSGPWDSIKVFDLLQDIKNK